MRDDTIELLAPAGSYETMKAAAAAGADAIYIGGQQFGARAYAENPDSEQLIEAIRYVHVRHKKLYLTINTLMKEKELELLLYPFLAPLYEAGLDAVIVQDLGAFQYVKENFPDLSIHASTQMTITGELGASELEKMGASRVVTARELSLDEIKKIRQCCDLEIESFIHGALCYCYSGQCLFSSMAGGRSGNRGRCAQPCRQMYQVKNEKQVLTGMNNGFVLSPKDMNTLAILPEIIEAGVTSLKIEGRMKKPEYTAGVVSIYRKYLDYYLKYGKKGYAVQKEDQQKLFSLFNRKGFSEGYYKKYNGKDMITLTKPEFRDGDLEYRKFLKTQYMDQELKEKIQGKLIISQEFPAKLKLVCRSVYKNHSVIQNSALQHEEKVIEAEVSGAYPKKAKNRPLTKETIEKQIKKMGNSPFELESLDIHIEDGLFMPVVELNQLRRKALEELEKCCYKKYERRLPDRKIAENQNLNVRDEEKSGYNNKQKLSVSAETREQLEAALAAPLVSIIYVASDLTAESEYKKIVSVVHDAKKECYLMLPAVFRIKAKQSISAELCKAAGFDGYLVRNMEELVWFGREKIPGNIITDHNLYTFNHYARNVLRELGAQTDTLPLELNKKELRERGTNGSEMIVYGRIPMMVSTQCIKKTIEKCTKKAETLILTDRLGNQFPVKNYCRYCYNIIYNNKPLSLIDMEPFISELSLQSVRLAFTIEDEKETEKILSLFTDVFMKHKMPNEKIEQFTRGHLKRGVE